MSNKVSGFIFAALAAVSIVVWARTGSRIDALFTLAFLAHARISIAADAKEKPDA